MLATRIIPCLDVDEGGVFKGIRFKNLVPAGDPVGLAQRYYEEGADELTFLDIGASWKSRKTLIEIVEKVSRVIFIPLCAGGGVKSLSDIKELLRAGADKVSICTAALENPSLLREASLAFGSQSIVLSIDAGRAGQGWHAFMKGGRIDSGLEVVDWARKGIELGAGEILLNSIDRDGTKEGYDLELLRTISDKVSVPVIASGGAGHLEDIYQAINTGQADAVLLASLLHFGQLTIPEIKNYLKSKGVKVR